MAKKPAPKSKPANKAKAFAAYMGKKGEKPAPMKKSKSC